MTLNAVVENAVMLLALCWLLAFTTSEWYRSAKLSAKLLAGLWFGSACILGMMSTSFGESGIMLDARTVVLSMAGLFGGPVVAGTAGVLAAGYRLWLGGVGVVPGLVNILLPILLGLTYRCLHRQGLIRIGFWQLLGFGAMLHLGVLGVIISLLPDHLRFVAAQEAAPPMLLALPLATAALGLLLNDLLKRDQVERALRLSEARLRAITHAIPDLLLVIDEDGCYLDIICADHSMLYADPSLLLGRHLRDVMPEAEERRFLEFIRHS